MSVTANLLATHPSSVVSPPGASSAINRMPLRNGRGKKKTPMARLQNVSSAEELSWAVSPTVLNIKQLSFLHQRQLRVTKPTTSAFQFKKAHFPALKPTVSPLRPHTRAQNESQSPATTDPQSLSSLLDIIKSSLSVFNIQDLCQTPRSLVLEFHTTSDLLSKIMVVLDAIVSCSSSSI